MAKRIKAKTPNNDLDFSDLSVATKFVRICKAHPILWDWQHRSHLNIVLRNKCWLKVARMLYPNLDSASKPKDKIKLLKMEWKSICDAMLRNSRKNLPYVHEKAMAFLLAADRPRKGQKRRYLSELANVAADSLAGPFQPSNMPTKVENLSTYYEDTAVEEVNEHANLSAFDAHQFIMAHVPCENIPISAEAHSTTHMRADPARSSNDQSNLNSTVGSSTIHNGQDDSVRHNNNNSVANRSPTGLATKDTHRNTGKDPDQAFFDTIKPMIRNWGTDKKLDFQLEVLKLLKTLRSN